MRKKRLQPYAFSRLLTVLVCLVAVFALALMLLSPARVTVQGAVLFPVSLHSVRSADYSADPIAAALPAVSTAIIGDALRDADRGGGSADQVYRDLQSPVPTAALPPGATLPPARPLPTATAQLPTPTPIQPTPSELPTQTSTETSLPTQPATQPTRRPATSTAAPTQPPGGDTPTTLPPTPTPPPTATPLPPTSTPPPTATPQPTATRTQPGYPPPPVTPTRPAYP
ncbi:MAG: hypothetical protein ACK4SN_09540 [Bellilinea sp.]